MEIDKKERKIEWKVRLFRRRKSE